MTQKFVTLPREVVEQAINALYCTDSQEGSPAYNFELKAVKELREALEQSKREPLTDKQIDAIAESMSGGLVGFLKGWAGGSLPVPFLEAAPQPQTVKECLTDELKPRFSAHDDAERLKSVARGMSYNDRGEAVWKHTLMEIAVRLESGGYAASQPQGEQEPVAWMYEQQAVRNERGVGGWDHVLRFCEPVPEKFKRNITPLYTQPQSAHKPLTDEQVLKAIRHLYQSDFAAGMGFHGDLDVARAIEAAHNIK